MPQNLTEIVEAFLNLINKLDSNAYQYLNNEEERVILNLLRATGQKPTKVTVESLIGCILDDDGRKTSQSYIINPRLRLCVHDCEGNISFAMSKWLEIFYDHSISYTPKNRRHPDNISILVKIIEESKPLTPIQLTHEGDILEEHYPHAGLEIHHAHVNDKTILSKKLGLHKYCEGEIWRIRVAREYNALYCNSCHLRISFPNIIWTYGELRKYMAQMLATKLFI